MVDGIVFQPKSFFGRFSMACIHETVITITTRDMLAYDQGVQL